MRLPSLLVLATLAAPACTDPVMMAPPYDTCVVTGFRCATDRCATIPTAEGCDDVMPVRGACTVERPRCFDPTDNDHLKYYCDPKLGGVCITPKNPLPKPCPPQYCTMADVTVCNTTNSDIFCRLPYMCIRIGARCGDGGVDGGMDAGVRD